MSTLPFLLSVADELDNINSQSYMDDFGLGFHPHRQYYRTPTIQLSLPANTDWMQEERQQRYRSHKFYYETQNNLQSTGEEDDAEREDEDKASGNTYETSMMDRYANEPSTSSAACGSRQKYASTLNSNRIEQANIISSSSTSSSRATATTGSGSGSGCGSRTVNNTANADDDDDDNIDNSVRMYNLSKKCCKNYHRHAIETNAKDASCHAMGTGTGTGTGTGSGSGAGSTGASSYRLHSKCMEGNNSSSDESLQKVSSSIEFLTCFLLKRSRASSSSSSSKNATGSSGVGGSSKKS